MWILFVALLFCTNISAETKILAFSGSTRKDSYNKKLLSEAASIAHKTGAKVQIIDLKEYPMPFYDGDLEDEHGIPANAKRLREEIAKSDAIMIASPEYNGSISAVLKNTLDWLSRDDEGDARDLFEGKKVAIMSTSPGSGGGKRGLVHLRAILEMLGAEVSREQVCLGKASSAFSPDGTIANIQARQELEKEVQSLITSLK